MAREREILFIDRAADWLMRHEPQAGDNRWRRRGFRILKLAIISIRQFHLDRCLSKAAALSFSLVLEAIPLSALVLFTLNKLFPAQLLQSVNVLIDTIFAEANQTVAHDLLDHLSAHIDTIGHGFTGLFVLAVLIAATMSIITMMESTWNEIWEVERNRHYWRKLMDFITAFLVGLILVFSLTLLSGGLSGGSLFLLKVVRGLILFFVLQKYLPNTRVYWRSAALGGLLSGGLWLVLRGGLNQYVLHVFTHSPVAKVYGSLALVPLTLIFIYLTWLLLLLGAELAFVHQNLDTLFARSFEIRRHEQDPAMRLGMLAEIARRHLSGDAAPLPRDLAAHYHVPHAKAEEIARALHDLGFVIFDQDKGTLHMAADPRQISVSRICEKLIGESVARHNERRTLSGRSGMAPSVIALYTRHLHALQREFSAESLAELAQGGAIKAG